MSGFVLNVEEPKPNLFLLANYNKLMKSNRPNQNSKQKNDEGDWCRKTCNQCLNAETMQMVPTAGKYAHAHAHAPIHAWFVDLCLFLAGEWLKNRFALKVQITLSCTSLILLYLALAFI